MSAPGWQLFTWGSAKEGQLGIDLSVGETELRTPTILPELCQRKIKKVACGNKHTLVLLYSGAVYTFGDNEYRQLGRDKTDGKPAILLSLETHKIIEIACGYNYSLALNDKGQVFAWGANSYGQLGRDTSSKDNGSLKMVRGLAEEFIVQISCGSRHSMALTRSSTLFVWGDNTFRQLGLPLTSCSPPLPSGEAICTVPTPLPSLQCLPIRQIAAGGKHSLVLTPSGSLYAWGSNTCGQVGLGLSSEVLKQDYPALVRALRGLQAVYVAAGEEHTVVLTREGGVFTFGAGSDGQLGHNDRSGSYLPRKVFELMGSEVCQVACGARHTLALVPSSGRLYAFGASDMGQLGVSSTAPPSGISMVKGNWVSTGPPRPQSPSMSTGPPRPQSPSMASQENLPPFVIRRVFTGGNHCFLMASKPEVGINPADLRLWDTSELSIAVLNTHLYSQLTSVKADDPLPEPLQTAIDALFSSHASLSASCLNEDLTDQTKDHMFISRRNHGLNLDQITAALDALVGRLSDLAMRRLWILLHDKVLTPPRPNFPDLECLRFFIFLAVSPLMDSIDALSTLVLPYCASVIAIEKIPLSILECWFGILLPRHIRKLVTNMIKFVVHSLNCKSGETPSEKRTREDNLKKILEFLKIIHRVNEKNKNIIPYTNFYISELREKINIDTDFIAWLQEKKNNPNAFSYCNYSFMYDGQAKSILLRLEAMMQMRQAVMQAHTNRFNAIFCPFAMEMDSVIPVFVMEIRRDNIIEDALKCLVSARPGDLKKPLKIKFVNEEGVDDGGVMKEFFLLIMREIMNPIYGMFRIYPDSHLTWFNESTLESADIFRMVGVMCGLAIYNNSLVDLAFPLALFKKLLDFPTDLDDLKELDPVVGRSLQELLDYEGDDLTEVFSLTFAMAVLWYDETKIINLLPPENDEPIPVTQENKQRYVDLYVDHVLNINCEQQYKAFYQGFHFVCGGHCLRLFRPLELQAIVVGSEMYNWPELRKHCEYQGDYWDKHPVIQWFWEVFYAMTEVQRKQFLRFLTGCDRVPITGMEAIKIKIQPTGGGDQFFPTAHTCYNLLDLPRYSDKETLRSKLLDAVQHTEGFTIV